MTSKLQNSLIVLGIVAIAGLGYYLYKQNGDVSLQNSIVNNQAAVETAEFLQRLNELKKIKLDGAIFSDERFMSLVDSSQAITPKSIGRENPFVEADNH